MIYTWIDGAILAHCISEMEIGWVYVILGACTIGPEFCFLLFAATLSFSLCFHFGFPCHGSFGACVGIIGHIYIDGYISLLFLFGIGDTASFGEIYSIFAWLERVYGLGWI